MHIEDALAKFLVQLEANGRSPHTIGQYSRHIRLLAAWLRESRGTEALEAVDHETVAAFLTSPEARLTSERVVKRPNSANALRTSMRCFFAYAHQAGWTRTNPARLVRRAICSPGPPRAMSDEQADKLLATIAAVPGPEARRDHALFALMLGSGIRIGTALALDVQDVDLERSELRLRRMKGGREDVAFLNERVCDHLREFIGTQPTGPLFQGRAGRRISRRHVERRLGQWLAKAGIAKHFSPHSLRHTCATRVYNSTGDVLLVKEVLRHRSISSSMIYVRPDEVRVRRALA